MIEIAIKNLKTRIQTTSFKNNLQSKFVPLYKSRQNVISFKNKLEDNKINYPTQKINKQTILPKTTSFKDKLNYNDFIKINGQNRMITHRDKLYSFI